MVLHKVNNSRCEDGRENGVYSTTFWSSVYIKDILYWLLIKGFVSYLVVDISGIETVAPANDIDAETTDKNKPEWYLLTPYGLLKAVSDKIVGELLLGLAILMFVHYRRV